MKKTIFAVIATIGISFTGALVHAAVLSAQVTVTEIVAFKDGHIDVHFSGNLGCGGGVPTWGSIQTGVNGATTDGVKAMISTLQAARLSGSKVVVGTEGANVWGLCNMYSVNLQ